MFKFITWGLWVMQCKEKSFFTPVTRMTRPATYRQPVHSRFVCLFISLVVRLFSFLSVTESLPWTFFFLQDAHWLVLQFWDESKCNYSKPVTLPASACYLPWCQGTVNSSFLGVWKITSRANGQTLWKKVPLKGLEQIIFFGISFGTRWTSRIVVFATLYVKRHTMVLRVFGMETFSLDFWFRKMQRIWLNNKP